jgi:uracil-DNA glycosylase family 4
MDLNTVQRRRLLDAIGVVRWVGRESNRDAYGQLPPRTAKQGVGDARAARPKSELRQARDSAPRVRVANGTVAPARLPSANRQANQGRQPVVPPPVQSPPTGTQRADTPPPLLADHSADLDWGALEAAVAGCTRCHLHASRLRPVFGVGDRAAEWLLIGEAPGADEDRQGEPFVGRAGQLLNNMLLATGHGREQVYIANILKSRPPGNRDPQPDEVAACMPYLLRQIALVKPKIILVVGRIAAHALLQTSEPLARLRGRVHTLQPGSIPLVVTYHPAYLLRTPREKRRAWDDLRLAMRIAGGR